MKDIEIQANIEAIIFAAGEPVSGESICQALEINKKALEKGINALQDKYASDESALELIKLNDCYQICTKSIYANAIRRALEIKKNSPLSQAAMEVLSVIAYSQPVTKSYIEQVRGVDCSGVVSSLLSKDLICENGRLDLPGRPILYITTPNFLRCFGLESLDELPPLPETEKTDTQETDQGEKSPVDDSDISEQPTTVDGQDVISEFDPAKTNESEINASPETQTATDEILNEQPLQYKNISDEKPTQNTPDAE